MLMQNKSLILSLPLVRN